MNKTIIVVIGILIAIVSIIAGSYTTNFNYGNRAERVIEAEYENMENILAQYSLKVMEAGQVPRMYTENMKDVMTSVMTARMGSDGSKATFQWFKEHNINLDSSMYKQIQQIIESGRNKFENAQTKLIDTKREYATNLGYLWKGMLLRIAGYPKINLDDYKIISSGHAKKAFDTKIDTGIVL